MSLSAAAFYLFAGIYLGAGLTVILARNPMHAALSLVLAFFSSAALWLFLSAEFLAILLVLIYVGAVMVLFLFVVMMLDINLAVLREGFIRWLPVGAAVAVLLASVIVTALYAGFGLQEAQPPPPEHGSALWLGLVLFTEYLYPFELAGAILLVAIVAAISLTHRGRRQRKAQDPAQQVRVSAADRVRLVDLKTDT